MNSLKKASLIKQYMTMISELKQRINETPVSSIDELTHDFTHLYKTQQRLVELEGVTVNGK